MKRICVLTTLALLAATTINCHAQQSPEQCELAAKMIYHSATMRSIDADVEDKVNRLVEDLEITPSHAENALQFVAARPSDSPDLLAEVIADDCKSGKPDLVDTDPRLHPTDAQVTAAPTDKTNDKCAIAGETAYKAAEIRFEQYTTNEAKLMELMQGGANVNLASALLAFTTQRPTDSSELLKQVVLDHCERSDWDSLDSDPRLHPIH